MLSRWRQQEKNQGSAICGEINKHFPRGNKITPPLEKTVYNIGFRDCSETRLDVEINGHGLVRSRETCINLFKLNYGCGCEGGSKVLERILVLLGTKEVLNRMRMTYFSQGAYVGFESVQRLAFDS